MDQSGRRRSSQRGLEISISHTSLTKLELGAQVDRAAPAAEKKATCQPSPVQYRARLARGTPCAFYPKRKVTTASLPCRLALGTSQTWEVVTNRSGYKEERITTSGSVRLKVDSAEPGRAREAA